MGTNAQIRAVIYGRQSKDKTKSIDEQIAECVVDAQEQGLPVAETYSDGVSASRFTTKKREDWDRLLADIDAGKVNVLILWESSRGDRSLTTWSALLDTCRARGVLIRVTTHGRTYDMRNPRDWRTLAEDGVDNGYESEKTSLRLKRAVAAGAAAGKPHGRCIFGYERVYDPITRKLVEQRPHPEQAPIVREIVTRVAKAEPISAIVRDLNARGIASPGGNRWERNTLRVVAMNVAYIGKRTLRGETYDAIWPPLVDDATFLAAQRVLTDPTRSTRPGRQRWLLSYLARCECGAFLHGVASRPSRRVVDRYECGAGCTSIRALDPGDGQGGLDEYVTRVVCRRLAKPDGLDLHRGDDAEVLAARAEAATLRARLNEFRDSAARGETSPASLARIEATLLAQIEAVDKRAVRATTPAVLADLVDATGRYEKILSRFDALPVAARREVIAMLLDITVRKAGTRGVRGFDPERVRITWK